MASSKFKREALLKKYQEYVQQAEDIKPKDKFSMGPLSLNLALGDPEGIDMGRVIQIVGKYSSGKSTLALDIIRQYQQRTGEDVFYLDIERSFKPDYAAAVGVDLSRLKIIKATTTEQYFNILEEYIDAELGRFFVLDSIAAMKPGSEEAKSFDDNPKTASVAGLITRLMYRIVPLLDDKAATLLVINQLRKNFSLLSQKDEVPFGAQALQFGSSVNVYLSRVKRENTQSTIEARIEKNKLDKPEGRAEYVIEYGRGIRHDLDLVRLATALGIVEKAGAWFAFQGIKAQGEEGAARSFPLDELHTQIIAKRNG